MSQALYTNAQQHRFLRVIPDLVRHRGLLRDMVWKELRARYRNAMMGFLWAVLQPVLMMLILTFVFGYLLRGMMGARLGSGEHSYAVHLLCGLVPWQFLAVALACGTNSLLESQDLIKKVYFPREIIPIAAVLNCLVNLAIGFVTLLVVIAALEGPAALGRGLLYLPVVGFAFAIQFVLVIGSVLLLSALNVFYRDITYMIDVILAFGFYATPIIYPLPQSMAPLPVPEAWKAGLYQLYLANPMTSLIEVYRQALLHHQLPEPALLVRPAVWAAVLLLAGVWVFRRNAPTFADHL